MTIKTLFSRGINQQAIMCLLLVILASFSSFLYAQVESAQEVSADVKTEQSPSVVEEEVDEAVEEIGDSEQVSEEVEVRPELKVEFDEYWEDQRRTLKEIEYLKKRIAEHDGDETSLFIRLTQRQLSMIDVYTRMTKNILAQQAEGLDVEEELAELSKYMMGLGPRARRVVEAHIAELEKEVPVFNSLTDQAVLKLTEINHYSDIGYQAISDHNQNLIALNFNNDQTNEYLKDVLYNRGEVLAGQIEIALKQREQARIDLADDKENGELKANVRLAQRKINTLIDSLRITITLLEENKMDSIDYRQLLIRTTGELTSDILKPRILVGLLTNWMSRAVSFVAQYSSEILFKFFIFFLILVIAFYLARLVGGIARRAIERSNGRVSQLMGEMLVSIASRTVFLIGLLVAINQMGISLAPVLAGLGVAGFIIGFALQDTLSNFASGIMILIYRPYDVGDMIEAGSVTGNVKSMNLVNTTMLTIDHQTLIIPNNKIWGDVINNLTAQRVRRIDMQFSIAHTEDMARIDAMLADVVNQHESVLSKPEPMIKLHKITQDSVEFIVRPWVKTGDYWPTYWDLMRAIKDRFDQEKVRYPYPQRDVNLYPSDGEESQN